MRRRKITGKVVIGVVQNTDTNSYRLFFVVSLKQITKAKKRV